MTECVECWEPVAESEPVIYPVIYVRCQYCPAVLRHHNEVKGEGMDEIQIKTITSWLASRIFLRVKTEEADITEVFSLLVEKILLVRLLNFYK
jgi:hypothetical protein